MHINGLCLNGFHQNRRYVLVHEITVDLTFTKGFFFFFFFFGWFCFLFWNLLLFVCSFALFLLFLFGGWGLLVLFVGLFVWVFLFCFVLFCFGGFFGGGFLGGELWGRVVVVAGVVKGFGVVW